MTDAILSSPDPAAFVANAALVTALYGTWPSFHDAEVGSLALDRGIPPHFQTSLRVRVSTFKVHRDQTDANGYYNQTDHALVTFRFDDIEELEIQGFNQQNVLACIVLNQIAERVHVTLDGIYGLHAEFHCARAAVEAVDLVASRLENTV